MRELLLTLGVVVLSAATVRLLIARRRQSRRLQQLAAARRLSFAPEDIIGLHERYQELELIRQGHSRCASSILYGSHPAGLVSAFCYTYDLGLGARAENRGCWMAVVETPYPHDAWSAAPADQADPADFPLRLDRFRLRSERPATLGKLQQRGTQAVIHAAPPECRWEVRGRLVAAAVPLQASLEQALDAALALAAHLNTPTLKRE